MICLLCTMQLGEKKILLRLDLTKQQPKDIIKLLTLPKDFLYNTFWQKQGA